MKIRFFKIFLFLIFTAAYSIFNISYHNSIHQASIESERLQEEALFSEGAFYYSFYKDFTKHSTTVAALSSYFQDSRSEAPNTINPHKRFNLSFELISGIIYRTLISFGAKVSPIKLYNSFTYILNGFSLFFVLLILYLLTKNIWLSAVPLSLFLTNIDNISRIFSNTPLRENIGITFLLAHVLFSLLFLKQHSFSQKLNQVNLKKIFSLIHIGFILSLFLQLIFWQFTQFSLIVNFIAVLFLYLFNIISKYKLLDYFILIIISWFITVVYLIGTPLVLNSLFFFITVCFIPLLLIRFNKSDLKPVIRAIYIIIPLMGGVLLHSLLAKITGQSSDSHVFKFLTERFQDSNNFHAKLYLCDDAFNSIGSWFIRNIKATGLYYLIIITIIITVIYSYKKLSSKNKSEFSSSIFLILITVGFSIIAYMSQRFTVIAVPLIIILISFSFNIITSKLSKNINIHYIKIVLPIVTALVIVGYNKNSFSLMWENKRPVSHQTLQQLTEFISNNTDSESTIAASMPLSSNIRLLTQRNIHVHPQYENKQLRERVKNVYKIYGNFNDKKLNSYFKKNKVAFVVIESSYCNYKSSTGCVMKDLINEGNYEDSLQFCSRDFSSSGYFNKIFDNSRFQVLKVL